MTPSLMIGTSSFGQFDRGGPVYDAFWARGGRAFDTAWIYGYSFDPGCCERVLGRWLGDRGVRDEAFVLVKGAHTPECLPDRVAGQLATSLDRMGLVHADLYMLHRDNLDVPVGEFVNAMNDLVAAGTISSYGVSNWSLERFREAEAYARERGLPPLAGLSNHYSLIEMVEPIHPGTVSARTSAWEKHLAASSCRLYPWASQGRGVFALDGAAEFARSPLAEHWFTDRNAGRLERARELARERDVSATVVALSWLWARPFAITPIVGPRTTDEVTDTFRAEPFTLTEQELQWLDGST